MINNEMEKILTIIEKLEERDLEFPLDDEDTLEIHLFSRGEFEEGQLGYRINHEGKNLINENGWHEDWYVIGYEELLGDPIVVDTKDGDFPIFTIAHDANWIPQRLANSLKSFLKKAQSPD